MHNHLTPTPIVDVNGKPTTVHKKTGAAPVSNTALAGTRPSLVPAKQKKEKDARIEYRMTQMPTEEGFLWEMGTGLGKHHNGLGIDPGGRHYGTGGGSATLTLRELFRYMRHGATFYEAARLSEFNSIDEWEQDEDFQRASAVCSTKFEKVVDIVESKDMKIADAFKLLGNGITDDLLEKSTLTDDQTLSIFSRFKYSHFTASKTANETPAMINALLDGSLPYAVFDGGYDKINVTKMCKELYGAPGKKAELTDDERQEMKADPGSIVTVLDLIENLKPFSDYPPRYSFTGDPYRNIGETYRALRMFGEEAVREVHPSILLSKLRDGSYLGVNGSQTAKSFIRHCYDNTKLNCDHWSPTQFSARVGNGTPAGLSITLADAVDMINAGLDDAVIVHLLVDLNLTVEQALEQAKSSPAPILLEGVL